MRQTNPAQRRYLRRFGPLMTSYVLILFAANRLIKGGADEGPLLLFLAALPTLPLLGVILVIGLYLREERDEYLRAQQVTAMLGGTGLFLATTTIWGFLELRDFVGHPPTFLAFPMWCGAFGVVHALLAIRDRLAGAKP